jgi:pantetheine-phosphate adenylyltransferase
MSRIALYAGSFDPITRGHEDLIRRSLGFVDRLIVALAINVAKQPLFSIEERKHFIRAAVGDDPRIEIREFEGLLVDFARSVGAAPPSPSGACEQSATSSTSIKWRS